MGFTHRLATEADIPALHALMQAAIDGAAVPLIRMGKMLGL